MENVTSLGPLKYNTADSRAEIERRAATLTVHSFQNKRFIFLFTWKRQFSFIHCLGSQSTIQLTQHINNIKITQTIII